MKGMTDAERIASVDTELAFRIIEDNQAGRGMRHLATDYGISEGIVRAIIRDSKLQGRPVRVRPVDPSIATDLWNRPKLWKRYGLKGPVTYRMV